MKTDRSREDYLEAILVIEQKRGEVRSVDVAEHLGFSKASVSRAVAQMAADGFILFGEDKRIRLTPSGRKTAEQVLEKHRFFKEFLENAGVPEDDAAEQACLIEHAVSDESFGKLKETYTNFKTK